MTLFEREAIAAGASGRNSGIVQHPMDPALVALYEDSLALYAELDGFELPEPAGVLIVDEQRQPAERPTRRPPQRFPELAPEWLEGDGAARRRARPGRATCTRTA